jgi:predicted small secreted protein
MKTSVKRIVILVIASALTAAFSSSCRTMHGFGHDVETLGQNIEESAR